MHELQRSMAKPSCTNPRIRSPRASIYSSLAAKKAQLFRCGEAPS